LSFDGNNSVVYKQTKFIFYFRNQKKLYPVMDKSAEDNRIKDWILVFGLME